MVQVLATAVALLATVLVVHGTNRYINPLVSVNSPDPGLIYDKFTSKYYVATTSGDDSNAFPVRISTNLTDWSSDPIGYLFPNGHWPSWCASDFWAPEFHLVSRTVNTYNNRNYPSQFYNVYFVCRESGTGVLSIGVAQPSGTNMSDINPNSNNNNGYYIDAIGKPLIEGNVSSGIGYIDPNFYQNPNNSSEMYILYKYDGNSQSKTTPIYIQKLINNGLTLDANFEPIVLIDSNMPWEADYDGNGNIIAGSLLVEAPWMVYNDVTKYYYLFYSGSPTSSNTYNIGVARSQSIESLFEIGKANKNNGNKNKYSNYNDSVTFEKYNGPILHARWGSPYVRNLNNIKWAGPGHCSVIKLPYNNDNDNDEQWIIMYHAWNMTNGKGYNGQRYLMMDLIEWTSDGWPRVYNDEYYDVPSETYTQGPAIGMQTKYLNNDKSNFVKKYRLDEASKWKQVVNQ